MVVDNRIRGSESMTDLQVAQDLLLRQTAQNSYNNTDLRDSPGVRTTLQFADGSGAVAATGAGAGGGGLPDIFGNNVQDIEAVGGDITIDLSSGIQFFRVNILANANFTITPPPTTGFEFTLTITFTQRAGAADPAVTFPASAVVPTIDNARGSVEVLKFTTSDGGATWTVINSDSILDGSAFNDARAAIMDLEQFRSDLESDPVGTLTELGGELQRRIDDAITALGLDDLRNSLDDFLMDPLGSITNFADEVLRAILGEDDDGNINSFATFFQNNTTNIARAIFGDDITDVLLQGIRDAGTFVARFIVDPIGVILDAGGSFVQVINDWYTTTNLQPIAFIRDALDSASLRNAWNSAVMFFEGLGQTTLDALEDAGEFFEGLGQAAQDAIKAAGEFFGDIPAIPGKIVDYIFTSAASVADFFDSVFSNTYDFITRSINSIFGDPTFLPRIIASLFPGAATVAAGIYAALDAAGPWLQGLGQAAIDRIDAAGTWVNEAATNVNNFITSSLQSGQAIFVEIAGQLKAAWDEFWEDLGIGIPDDVPETILGTIQEAAAFIRNIIRGGDEFSFPIIFTEAGINTPTDGDATIDLSSEFAHVAQIRVVEPTVIRFSNLPSAGKRIFFQIEITQDESGGHAVTFPESNVETAPSVSTLGNALTIVTGFANHEHVYLAEFGDRFTNVVTNTGTIDVTGWSNFPVLPGNDLEMAGNTISTAGAVVFQAQRGAAARILPTADGISVEAGDERNVVLKSSPSETVAVFSEEFHDMRGHRLANLADPQNDFDSVTKRYVDDRLTFGLDDLTGVIVNFPAPSGANFLKLNSSQTAYIQAALDLADIPRIPYTHLDLPELGIPYADIALPELGIPYANIAIPAAGIPRADFQTLPAGRLLSTNSDGEISISIDLSDFLDLHSILDDLFGPTGDFVAATAGAMIQSRRPTADNPNTYELTPFNAQTINDALAGFNPDSGSLQSQINNIMTGGGGGTFNPANLMESLIPGVGETLNVGSPAIEFNAGYFDEIHARELIGTGGSSDDELIIRHNLRVRGNVIFERFADFQPNASTNPPSGAPTGSFQIMINGTPVRVATYPT